MAPDLPRVFGRYRLQTQLSRGARSHVYLAQDTALNRAVAVKVLAGDVTPERLPVFFREAKPVIRLKHPAIVAVHDLGEVDGQPFLAMEHLVGEVLARTIARGATWNLAMRLDLIDRLCDALGAAHAGGVVHHDLRPSKMIVSGSRLTVLGFGLARALETARTTREHHAGGVAYLAPEQIAGETADHRADLFSAAIVAYELLTEMRAYSDTPAALERRVADSAVASVVPRLPDFGAEVDALMRRALARQPADRFQTAGELREAFRTIRQELDRQTAGADGDRPASKSAVSPFADTEKTPMFDVGIGGAAVRQPTGPPPVDPGVDRAPVAPQSGRILLVRMCGEADAVVMPFGRTLAGRALDAGLLLMSRAASRHHAAIVVSAATVTVEDLGSENGTTINGIPAAGVCPVEHGDAIAFADLVFRVEVTRTQPARSEPDTNAGRAN